MDHQGLPQAKQIQRKPRGNTLRERKQRNLTISLSVRNLQSFSRVFAQNPRDSSAVWVNHRNTLARVLHIVRITANFTVLDNQHTVTQKDRENHWQRAEDCVNLLALAAVEFIYPSFRLSRKKTGF